MFRVVYGDAVRMIVTHHLPAGVAGKAGFLLSLTQNCRREELCQGVFAGAGRAGYEIKMGNTAATDAERQVFFQPFIAQQTIKSHIDPP